jgi:hypothetical protein
VHADAGLFGSDACTDAIGERGGCIVQGAERGVLSQPCIAQERAELIENRRSLKRAKVFDP